MSDHEMQLRSQTFDKIAERYDTYRPSYPAELFDDIIQLSEIDANSQLLEIGTGTGKATLPFAQRGFSILCIEPGENLLKVAQRNLSDYPKVHFENGRFENWDPHQKTFDLIFSAQAFHWVPEEVRYSKTAEILNENGHLAIFWNMSADVSSKLQPEIDQQYKKLAPEIAQDEQPLQDKINHRAAILQETPTYDELIVKTYPWSTTYKTTNYLSLLHTNSDHLLLADENRTALFKAIGDLIDKNGGEIEIMYVALLYLLRKKS